MMLGRFLRNQNGNTGMMLGLAMVPLCIVAGGAIDMVRMNNVRTHLQGAADAAALAGGTSKDKSDETLNAVVSKYLAANGVADIMEQVTSIDQHLDPAKGTFSVTVNGKLSTSLMVLAGIKSMDVGATSVVNVGSQALEMVLVLDNTGSMAGTKIANLKSAATNLVNIIQRETSDYANVKIGLVPFAEYVNVGMANAGASWIDTTVPEALGFAGCVGSKAAPNDEKPGTAGGDYPALGGVPCNVPLLPLTSNLESVKTHLAGMVSTGATYIPTGLLWGWNLLDAKAPFTEASTDAELKTMNGRKALVLMTDGENTISPSYPLHDNNDTAYSNQKLADMCEGVKKDGIEVYTVSFMVPSDTIKDILVGCASTPAKYFDADNGTELTAAFTEIAKELAAVRLTQ